MTSSALWLLSWIVPSSERDSWRREWLAEFEFAARRGGADREAPSLRTAGRLWAAGQHALYLRARTLRLDALVQDVRHGARALRRRPAFSVAAVLTLALGIAGTTVMFGTLRAVLWRPLPFADPDRLVLIGLVSPGAAPDPSSSVSPADFADWQRQVTSTSAMAAIRDDGYAITGDVMAEQVSGNAVTGRFFETLGVPPAVGRVLTGADDVLGAPDVVMLSERLWQRRYGRRADIVGRRIVVDGVSREVVGVMPASFDFPIGADLWTPLRFTAGDLKQRGAHYLTAVGRLRPDATLATATAEVSRLGETLSPQNLRSASRAALSVVPLRLALVGDVAPALRLLFGSVALVFLIACVNVASLVLGSAMSRGRDLAVRAALGAGRGRLVRGLFVESAILAGLGGALGIGLAAAGVRAVAAANITGIVLLDGTRIDGAVLAFAIGATAFSAVLFGAWPAWRLSRHGSAPELAGAGERTASRHASRARGVLVLAEIAIAVSLLVGAGLLARSFLGLTRVPLGLDVDAVHTASVSLPDAGYHDPDRRALFVSDVLGRLAANGEVRSAAATFGLPLTSFSYFILVAERDGQPVPATDGRLSVEVRTVTPRFFETIGIPLVSGRDFTAGDRRGSASVVMVNQRAAALLWPQVPAIGHRVVIATRLGLPGDRAGGEVVGVVADVHDVGPAAAARPIVYLCGAQYPMGFLKFVVKASGATDVAGALREAVRQEDPTIPVFAERSMREIAARVIAQPRFYLQLVGLFAGVAIALAGIGIYGVMAQSVGARTREIGIRLALGATSRGAVGLILRQAGMLAAGGIVIGLGIALAASRLLATLLFGITPGDAVTLASVSVLTLAIAALAAWIPARRAARVDPVTTLRTT